MIALSDFLKAVDRNASRVNAYRQPGDGSDGTCDCIGLIIGAKRLAGGYWRGTHGSNYSARNEMVTFGPFSNANELFLGEVVYKAREPGDAYYALPEKYKKGSDLNDYYHVGVVTRLNPLEITHCTSPGPIAKDTKIGKWRYGGQLKDIDYGSAVPSVEPHDDGKEKTVVKKMVKVGGGNIGAPINMRGTPSTSGKLVDQIPQGAEVEVVEPDGDWSKVKYRTRVGYVMNKFLIFDEEPVIDDGSEEAGIDDVPVEGTVVVSRAELEEIYLKIGDLLGYCG